jgi:serine/threonine-protein kinase
MSDVADRIAGALAGTWEVLGIAGEGGMAVVFRARGVSDGSDVAIKVFRPELSSRLAEARFQREVEIARELSHPGIVAVIESGVADGLLYFVMPYIEGETLAKRIDREGSLPLDEALRIAGEAGDALAYAHSAGIIHRDIKPGNIILGPTGAMVADFGVARALESAGGDRLTISGFTVGTPRYMSPEQGAGDRRIDQRTDQYSLACVLFEMLVGEPPFTGPTAKAVIARHISETPPSIGVVRPVTPAGVVWAINRALAKNAADRFATIGRFIEALSKDPPRSASRGRTVWWRAAGLAAVGVATAALAFAALNSPTELDPRRVLVFAPEDAAGDGQVNGAVATYIGYVLEGTDPLRWEEARDWLAAGQSGAGLSIRDRRSVARRAGAAYFIDGEVMRETDSLRVILRLYDAATGDLLERAGRASDPSASEARLGAIAVGELLAAIIDTDRIDLGALSERSPAAIARFYQGEVAYDATRFDEALGHYSAAVDIDSVFAIAAVKGAQAAGWIEDVSAASYLADLAIRNESLLPAKYRPFIHGLRHYHAGRADSAVAQLERTTAEFPEWAEGWAALAEVYYHLMPRGTGLDSIARDRFQRAFEMDSVLSPPLYHLAEMAIREGDLDTARRLAARLEAASPYRTISTQLTLMMRCAEEGPSAISWMTVADTAAHGVLSAAQAMAPSPALRDCAAAAADAVLRPNADRAWGALLVLQSVLLAEGRLDELRSLLQSERVELLPAGMLLVVDAIADPRLSPAADSVYDGLGTDFAARPSSHLWLMLEWASASGRTDDATAIAELLIERGAAGDRNAVLLSGIAAAHEAVATGDANAAALFAALRPTANSGELVWGLWEPLIIERLARADVLIARDSTEAARTILVDALSHRSVAELLFSPMRGRLLAELANTDRG